MAVKSKTGAKGPALGQTLLMVRDPQMSKQFYMEVLGLKLNYDHGEFVSLTTSNGAWIGLHLAEKPEEITSPGIELDFKVDDVDREYERIKALGVPLKGPPEDMPWKWRHLFLRDPDGYNISLYTRLVRKTVNPKTGEES